MNESKLNNMKLFESCTSSALVLELKFPYTQWLLRSFEIIVCVGSLGWERVIMSWKRKNNPGIKIIAHPECPPDVIKASDFAGSTSGMIKYVEDNQPKKVMMVTECSMSDNIQVENPNVDFIRPCNLCPHMKRITLPKILACLENETGEIIMDNETINKARIPVERMIAIGR